MMRLKHGVYCDEPLPRLRENDEIKAWCICCDEPLPKLRENDEIKVWCICCDEPPPRLSENGENKAWCIRLHMSDTVFYEVKNVDFLLDYPNPSSIFPNGSIIRSNVPTV
jgi:hypothetical protein